MSYALIRWQTALQKYGQTLTIKTRSIFDGKPALVVATGGSIPAGTHYYRVNPRFSGVEKPLGGIAAAVSPGSGKVTLSGYGVTNATDYRIYRNTDASFPTPSLITTTVSTSYIDSAASAGAGAAPNASGDPYEYFTSGTILCYVMTFLSMREMDVLQHFGLPAGINIEDERILFTDPATVIKPLDRIVFDGKDWSVIGVHPIFSAATNAMNMVSIRRMGGQSG